MCSSATGKCPTHCAEKSPHDCSSSSSTALLLFPFFAQGRPKTSTDTHDIHSRVEVDPDGAADVFLCLVDEGEDPRGDGGPLQGKGRHQQVEPHAAVPIATQKCHQEPEPNKHHHVHILEDYFGEGRSGEEWSGGGGRLRLDVTQYKVVQTLYNLVQKVLGWGLQKDCPWCTQWF